MSRLAPKQAPPRGRMTVRAAAAFLGCSPRTVWVRIAEGVLSNATPPDCRGRGRPAYVWRDEVERLAEHGEAACRDLRRSRGRIKPGGP